MSICFLSLDSSKIFNQLILKALLEEGFDGLSETLITLFPYIDANKKITTSQLSKQLGYSRQAMHKNVKKLQDLGYISFTQENQKVKSIQLTQKGEKLMREANEQIAKIEEKISTLMGERELQTYKKSQLQIYEYLASMK